MRPFGQDSSLLCRIGVHKYSPDTEAGYPYQECVYCEKLGIFHPRRTLSFELNPLRR